MSKRCKHKPAEEVTAFVHRCKHCGVDIEPVECDRCMGSGFDDDINDDCPDCKGTGTKKWRKP